MSFRLEFVEADQCGGEIVKGLKMVRGSFVAELKATEIAEPTERSLDDIACSSESASMLALGVPVGSELRLDAALSDPFDNRGDAIGGVALENLGLATWSAVAACHRRNLIEHRQGSFAIGLVGWSSLHNQRNSPRIRNHMAFAALFAAVRRIGTRMVPPKTARTEALSITARDKRSEPRFPNCRSNRRCTSGQTPAAVHSCSRRQQVTPLHTPSRLARNSKATRS